MAFDDNRFRSLDMRPTELPQWTPMGDETPVTPDFNPLINALKMRMSHKPDSGGLGAMAAGGLGGNANTKSL